jgi:hypothetical protein
MAKRSMPQEFGETVLDEIEFHRRFIMRIGLAPH